MNGRIASSNFLLCRRLQQYGATRTQINIPRRFMAMKPGLTIQGLGIYKGQDPPVVLKRDEYPEWVNDLNEPLPTLAALRRMPNEEAKDKDIMRFLKLQRRLAIRKRNEEGAKV